MGFFSSIFRGRDAPADRTSGSAYSFFMGGSTSGKRVNERTAMHKDKEGVARFPYLRLSNSGLRIISFAGIL